MIPARNADDFLQAFMRAREAYEKRSGPMIQQLRDRFDTDHPDIRAAKERVLDKNLEVHGRVYVVNALLAGLNWRIEKSPADDLPNIIPEAAIRSQERGTRRYMDYLSVPGARAAAVLYRASGYSWALWLQHVNNPGASRCQREGREFGPCLAVAGVMHFLSPHPCPRRLTSSRAGHADERSGCPVPSEFKSRPGGARRGASDC